MSNLELQSIQLYIVQGDKKIHAIKMGKNLTPTNAFKTLISHTH